ELTSYGKPLVIEREPCDINQVINNEIWLAKPPSRIRIVPRLSSSIPKVSLDAGRFAEAIKELLRNAISAFNVPSHSNRAGQLVVATQFLTGKNESSTDPRNYITIEVTDDGPGFPPGFPIFEPFQSTNPNSTGLGLATVKELVEAHGGQINATCVQG